jgi:hypothetical protein
MGIIPHSFGEKLGDAGSEPASSFGISHTDVRGDQHTRDKSRLVDSAGMATANCVVNGVDVGKRTRGAKQSQQSMLKIRTQTNRTRRQLLQAVYHDRLAVTLVVEVVRID